jgi:hypothetical protein
MTARRASSLFASLFMISVLAAVPFLLTGCPQGPVSSEGNNAPSKLDQEAKIQAARAKLSPEDRTLVDAQEWCAVGGSRLGSMGTPLKVMVKGQPVFLCCGGCEDEAKAEPEKTLAKVEELKAKAKAAKQQP